MDFVPGKHSYAVPPYPAASASLVCRHCRWCIALRLRACTAPPFRNDFALLAAEDSARVRANQRGKMWGGKMRVRPGAPDEPPFPNPTSHPTGRALALRRAIALPLL